MNEIIPQHEDSARCLPWPWLLLSGCVLIFLLALLLPRPETDQPIASGGTNSSWSASTVLSSPNARLRSASDARPALAPQSTAEEIVAAKLIQFGKSRRDLVHALAKHFRVDVPWDVERFFDAVERGRWEEIDAAHTALLAPGQGLNQPRSAELHQIWRAIQETWGAAREAHNWPAQKLLDYGEAVLGSLRPGMIYVGGTDPGCFIPTFLNETSDGERRITLTQNALADGTYLDYLNYLYGDRFATLTHDDSQRTFQDYIADAQKRLRHDQEFPDEPKQIRPGEDVRMVDGSVQVSGQVAVMAINERMIQMLIDKNPAASFALEQSFPFASLYAQAAPLGPVMKLRVLDGDITLNADRAARTVDYWGATARQILGDPEAANSTDVRMAYGKMAAEQAALLKDRKFMAEAEQTFRLATEIAPTNPEAVFRYVNLLLAQGRVGDAAGVAQNAAMAAPDNAQFRDLIKQLIEHQPNRRTSP